MIRKLLRVPAEAVASRHIYKVLHRFPVVVLDVNMLQFDLSDLPDEDIATVREILGGVPFDIVREESFVSVHRYRPNGNSVRCSVIKKEEIRDILKNTAWDESVKLDKIAALVGTHKDADLAEYMVSDPWFSELNGIFKMVDGHRL